MKLISILLCSFSLIFSTVELRPQGTLDSKVKLAESYDNIGDYINSSRLYLELLNSNPNKIELLFAYANAMMKQNKYSELLPKIDQYLNKVPSNDLYNLKAVIHWKLGKIEDANAAWKKAITEFKPTVQLFQNTAASQSNLMLFDKAVETLTQGRKVLDTKDIYIDELSKLFTALRDYEKAIKEIFHLFEMTRNYPQTQGRLQALTFDANSKKYILEQLKAKESDPNRGYRVLYAWFLASIGEFEKSLAMYIAIDKESKGRGAEIYTFATSRHKDGQYEIAQKAYEALLAMGKDTPYLLNALFGYNRVIEHQLIERQGTSNAEFINLIEKYREIIKLYPNSNFSYDAQYRIAYIYFNNLRDYDKAITELQQLIKLPSHDPKVPKYYNLLGDIYLYTDKIEDAKSAYSKSLTASTSQSQNDKNYAQFKLADIHFYTGATDSALNIYNNLSTLTDQNIANDAIEKSFFIEQNKSMNKAISDFAMAEKYEFQDKDSLAILKYKECISISSDELLEEATLRLSMAYTRSLKKQEAIQTLEQYLKDTPETINIDKVYYYLANAYLDNKQYDEAEKTFTTILEKFPRTIYLEDCRTKVRDIRSRKHS